MTVSTQHPQYVAMIDRWRLLRDSYDGESVVKSKNTTYLPATSGMIADGYPTMDTLGWHVYQAYKQRAVFHNWVEMAVNNSLGKLHAKPAAINLPAAMEGLRERATVNGDSLELALSKINEEQLKVGRIGVLVDLPTEELQGAVLPYLALYRAETIINWDDGQVNMPRIQNVNLVVLDESEYQRYDYFTWEYQNKYRILVLGDTNMNEKLGEGTYAQAIVTDDNEFNPQDLRIPQVRGQTLDEIPFMFINATDLQPKPTKPPLETLGNLGMTMYRGEADYRQSLFMTGQDTLVLIGVADQEGQQRVGANAKITIASPEGDAKYIGPESDGISEQREALQNDATMAQQLSGNFVERANVESGDAMRRRLSAKNATLTDIAILGAEGLERSLKQIARWIGANENEVEIIPNLDFVDDELRTGMLNEWMAAKMVGAPVSLMSIWQNLKKRELTQFDTFEEEIQQIQEEMSIEINFGQPPGIGVDDEDPDDEPEEDPEDDN